MKQRPWELVRTEDDPALAPRRKRPWELVPVSDTEVKDPGVIADSRVNLLAELRAIVTAA